MFLKNIKIKKPPLYHRASPKARQANGPPEARSGPRGLLPPCRCRPLARRRRNLLVSAAGLPLHSVAYLADVTPTRHRDLLAHQPVPRRGYTRAASRCRARRDGREMGREQQLPSGEEKEGCGGGGQNSEGMRCLVLVASLPLVEGNRLGIPIDGGSEDGGGD